jgi:hypothetical protein
MDSDTLKEVYCFGDGSIEIEEYSCLLGCEDGACLMCLDSDGGVNKYMKGTVRDSSGNIKTDECQQYTDNLIEYYCHANGLIDSFIIYDCSCVNGMCPSY